MHLCFVLLILSFSFSLSLHLLSQGPHEGARGVEEAVPTRGEEGRSEGGERERGGERGEEHAPGQATSIEGECWQPYMATLLGREA